MSDLQIIGCHFCKDEVYQQLYYGNIWEHQCSKYNVKILVDSFKQKDGTWFHVTFFGEFVGLELSKYANLIHTDSNGYEISKRKWVDYSVENHKMILIKEFDTNEILEKIDTYFLFK